MIPISGRSFMALQKVPRKRLRPKEEIDESAPQEEEPIPELIHPQTASYFREWLDPLVGRLPRPLVKRIAEQGYRIHVVDTQGRFPLTLEIDEILNYEPGSVENPEELAWERGAETDAEVQEFCDLLAQGQGIPAFHYWQGLRIPKPAWAFLSQPLHSFVAGMVLHEQVVGLRHRENRIVFWDCAFERGDGLADWYVLHELGHTVDYAFAFTYPELWRGWLQRVEANWRHANLLTRYAGESVHEYVAEGFAAWATPDHRERDEAIPGDWGDLWEQRRRLDRPALEKVDPQLVLLLEEAVRTLQS